MFVLLVLFVLNVFVIMFCFPLFLLFWGGGGISGYIVCRSQLFEPCCKGSIFMDIICTHQVYLCVCIYIYIYVQMFLFEVTDRLLLPDRRCFCCTGTALLPDRRCFCCTGTVFDAQSSVQRDCSKKPCPVTLYCFTWLCFTLLRAWICTGSH